MSCLLGSLQSSALKGITPGLVLGQTGVDLQKDLFGCCGGTGMYLDEAQAVTRRCTLRERLGHVLALIEQFQGVWGESGVAIPAQLHAAETKVLEQLLRHSKRQCFQGLVATTPSREKPGAMWAVALAAAWRFGLKPHIISHGRTPYDQLLPSSLAESPSSLVLVEHAGQLWQGERADEIELLISYCHRSLIPLWIEFIVEPRPQSSQVDAATTSSGGPRRVSAAIAQRLQKVKAESPTKWLTAGGRHKLSEVTLGLQRLGPAAEQKPASAPVNRRGKVTHSLASK